MLQLTTWPNPILLSRCPEVTVEQIAEKRIGDLSFRQIYEGMRDIMHANRGCGLAANQANLNARIFVTDDSELPCIINPVLTEMTGRSPGAEGCLSLPGIHGYVMRSEKLVITGTGKKGELIWLRVKDRRLARICQHETDHLDGICFIDKMAETDKKNMKDKLDDLKRDGPPHVIRDICSGSTGVTGPLPAGMAMVASLMALAR